MKKQVLIFASLFFFSCAQKSTSIKPTMAPITESVYASGTIKSLHQYQAFATVNGIIENILVKEGDTVSKGDALLTIVNDAQRLSKENAQLTAEFADINVNQAKLNDALQAIELAKRKVKNDSSLLARQQQLWQQNIGSKVELEQRELSLQNAQSALFSAVVRHDDLKRQLLLNAAQSQKNLQISTKLASDFTLRSDINGVVYSLPKKKGELVGAQTPLAVIGDAFHFVLEMQVDEYDILKVKKGMRVLVTMDSYKGKVFEAVLTKIDPLMNERSKSFLVEANFVNAPPLLYPNVSFEANIVLQMKEKALLVPRAFVLNDSFVLKKNGEKVAIKTGLKDYKMVEVISGITASDELINPAQ